ncbi:MAG: N-acetyltransferase [Thermoflexales bacterium]|nr:N-acetyltransferase [Thermoflexales bacterium]
MKPNVRIHPTAEVSPDAEIGAGTSIWHHAQIREGAVIGSQCVIGKGVYIDFGVHIGDHVKIQNYVSIYHGVTIQDGVFIGPHVCFTNDKRPRAVNPDGSLKGSEDWVVSETLVMEGAAIGANSVIVCGTTIGQWAMVGAGSVVTRDVPDYGLVWGNPARLQGFVCPCGEQLQESGPPGESGVLMRCPNCGKEILIPRDVYQKIGG